MPYDSDDHPGPTKVPPPDPEGEPMVGKPAASPGDPTNAVRSIANCVSFAAAARRKRRYTYSPPSGTRPALFPAAPPVVILLRTHEMRLRFGIEDRTEAPEMEATDASRDLGV